MQPARLQSACKFSNTSRRSTTAFEVQGEVKKLMYNEMILCFTWNQQNIYFSAV